MVNKTNKLEGWIKQVFSSADYQKLKKQYQNMHLFLIFIVLNNNLQAEKIQLNFLVPETRTIINAAINNGNITFTQNEAKEEDKGKRFDSIEQELSNIKFDTLLEIINHEVEKRNAEIERVIMLILKQERLICDVTCVTKSFKLLKIKIDCTNYKAESSIRNLFST